MYHIAICDDNEADRLILQELLLKDSKRAEQIMIHEYSSGESLLINLYVFGGTGRNLYNNCGVSVGFPGLAVYCKIYQNIEY